MTLADGDDIAGGFSGKQKFVSPHCHQSQSVGGFLNDIHLRHRDVLQGFFQSVLHEDRSVTDNPIRVVIRMRLHRDSQLFD